MKTQRANRVIVLGVDGLDPNILEEMMTAGALPAFSRIKEAGTYQRLATSNPSQSPVAWSTIATGSNPGYHGIFDFISRKPKNYLPVHSIVKVNPTNILARRSSMFLPVRKGTPFWAITSQMHIPTTVIRWPITFPPEEIYGNMLSGLGVLDLKSSIGRYSFYTTGTISGSGEMKGHIIPISSGSNAIQTKIIGPNNASIPMNISIDKEHSAVTLTIDRQNYTVKEGEWSDWIRLKFSIMPLRHVSGICRVYLDSVKNELRLYLSPIQVDPLDPAFSISYPDGYATELAHNIDNFGTLGSPEDTNALSDGCFNDEAFLSLCDRTMEERKKMLWYELERFKEGLLAFVFDTTDRIQHIYWSTGDPEHPTYDNTYAQKFRNVITDYYQQIDKIVQRVLNYEDGRTVICILSDHGFSSFRRAVHLNSWLVQNGLMVLREPTNDGGEPLFKNVVWEKTRAYAVGFSSIYLNLRGREGKGIVSPGNEAEKIRRNIGNLLARWKDPKSGSAIMRNVYPREDLYRGPYVNEAPDLILGFEPNYRASWQTAIGGAPLKTIEDNLGKWTGDHMCDAPSIPGVFLINRKTRVPHPKVTDIAPTILACFQIPQPENMEGNTLLG